MKKLFSILTISVFMLHVQATAQSNKYIKQGNKLYEQNKYPEAQKSYMEALQKDSNSVPGRFNLGNTLFKQKQFDASRSLMGAAAQKSSDKNVKGGANYNIGNTYMAERKWEDAVEAYKNALRNNPADVDAKYNLSYAEEMLKKDNQQNKDKNKDKKQQQNKDQQNKDKQNKDQQKKDQQNKDQQNKDQQNKDNKDNKDKQDKDGQGKDQQDKDKQDQQHPEPQPSKMSKKQAEELLNALDQQEKNLQDKKQKGKTVPVKLGKDW